MITKEKLKDLTPNIISRNLNKELDYTGIELTEEEKKEFLLRPVQGRFPNFGKLDLWEDVKHLTPFLPSKDKKQVYGACDRYATNYIQKEAMILSGIEVNQEFVIDVDYDYANRTYQNNKDVGTVVLWSHNEFVKNGKPVCFREQASPSNRMGRNYLDFKNNINNELIGITRIFPFYKKIKTGKTAIELFKEIKRQKDNGNKIVFRFSIINDNGVSVYHRTVPKIIGERDLRGGAHSLAGVGSTGVFEFNKEPSIQSFESTGSVPNHIWKLSVATRQIYQWEIFEVKKPIEYTPKKDIKDVEKEKTEVYYEKVSRRCYKGKVCRNIESQVIAIQEKLKLKADGIFGAKTERAVKVFQKANGLKADGIVGAKTWRKLFV